MRMGEWLSGMKRLKIILALIIIFLVFSAAGTVGAADAGWLAAGLRGGIDDNRNLDEDYRQFEAFALYDLPWSWQVSSASTVGTCVEGNLGFLSSSGRYGVVGSVGPSVYLRTFNKRLFIIGGINATLISRDEYGDDDFGGPFQFTSHIGLNYRFGDHLSIGYRLQHMSNAGIYDKNPGINFNMLELGYFF